MYFGDQALLRGIIGKYVFRTVGSICILMLFSLAIQKLVILMRSHLLILPFTALALGDVFLTMLLCGRPEIFLPMFSCRTFIEI